MANSSHTDRARGAALDRIERSERFRKLWVVATCATEVLFFVAFLWLADLSDRLHLLVLMAALLVYMTLGVGMITLWSHANVCTARILRALDSTGSD